MMWWLDATDMIAGLAIGIFYTRNYYTPVLPVKVTHLPPDDSFVYDDWSLCVAGIVAKLEVGAVIGDGVSFNRVGSANMAKLLKNMGECLDSAVEQQCAHRPELKAKVIAHRELRVVVPVSDIRPD